MPKEVKSLVQISQETVAKNLELLTDVGCVPYGLLKESFKRATAEQLHRIENCNPEIMIQSNDLWLPHCLAFKDVRDEYQNGMHKNPKEWRNIYLNKNEENERRRQLVKEKLKNQYSKIQSDKAARSIKVLHGVVPTKKGTCGSTRRFNASKLFQQSKREADKVASIYQSKKSTATIVTQRIRAPLKPNQVKPPKIIPPMPTIASSVIRPEKIGKQESSNSKPTESKKPVAMVNFNIFKEVNRDLNE